MMKMVMKILRIKATLRLNRKNRKVKIQTRQRIWCFRGVDFRNVACVLNFDLPTLQRHIFIELEEQQELESWYGTFICVAVV